MVVPQLGLPPFLLSFVLYINNTILVIKMTKIPLGIPKHFQLWYNSFFIIYKLIALGIIGIGQVIKKTKTQFDPRPWTRPVSAIRTRLVSKGHDPCSHLRTVLLPKILHIPSFVPKVLALYQCFLPLF